jgi:hypothetical protein
LAVRDSVKLAYTDEFGWKFASRNLNSSLGSVDIREVDGVVSSLVANWVKLLLGSCGTVGPTPVGLNFRFYMSYLHHLIILLVVDKTSIDNRTFMGDLIIFFLKNAVGILPFINLNIKPSNF